MKDKQNEFYDTNFSRPVKFDKSFEISPDKTWRTFENQPSKNLNAQSKLKSIFLKYSAIPVDFFFSTFPKNFMEFDILTKKTF